MTTQSPKSVEITTSTRFLVVGATGHVGSKIAILLADRGYDVTALVRSDGATIRDPHRAVIRYVTGDLADDESMAKAVEGIDVVISTANGVIPQKKSDTAARVNDHALRFVAICENAGVKRFVQSSTPSYPRESRVPELAGKRRLEERLQASPMQSVIVRNAAFMDVFLVMGGFKQATDASAHATVNRNHGFTKFWGSLTGNLVQKWGFFLAPGGASHGSPIIATRDVAEMITGAALYPGSGDLLIEANGPQWLTWREIVDTIAMKTGARRSGSSHSRREWHGSIRPWPDRSLPRQQAFSPSWASSPSTNRAGTPPIPSACSTCPSSGRCRDSSGPQLPARDLLTDFSGIRCQAAPGMVGRERTEEPLQLRAEIAPEELEVLGALRPGSGGRWVRRGVEADNSRRRVVQQLLVAGGGQVGAAAGERVGGFGEELQHLSLERRNGFLGQVRLEHRGNGCGEFAQQRLSSHRLSEHRHQAV